MSASVKMCSAAAAILALLSTDASALTWKLLTLSPGWTRAASRHVPAIAIDADGIVHMRGALTAAPSGCDHVPFVIPQAFRPSKYVDLPVDETQDGTYEWTGRIDIAPNGTALLQTAASAGNDDTALCTFTSIEGLTYSK